MDTERPEEEPNQGEYISTFYEGPGEREYEVDLTWKATIKAHYKLPANTIQEALEAARIILEQALPFAGVTIEAEDNEVVEVK